jgi:transposase
VEDHYYSAPCRLVHQKVDARITPTTVEILHKGERVRSHARSFQKYKHTTHPEDMPLEHRHYSEWTPSRIIEWAGKIGPSAADLVQKIIQSKDHPEQGYRSALGVIRLERSFGQERLEAACKRSSAFKSYSYKSVKRILKNGAERQPLPGSLNNSMEPRLPFHENIRGSVYYHEEGNA